MEKDMKGEINDMLNSLTGGPGTSAPATEAPATEAVATEAPATEAVTTEAPATEAVATEAPATEAPEDKDETIAELRRKLAEKETPATKAPTTEAPLAPEPQDFIGDLDPDEVMRDKVAINKILNTVYSKGLNDARKVIGEGVLRGIPDIVKANIKIMTELKETSDKFYKDNADLAPFKQVVAAVFEEVASQNPGKKYGELLKEVGTETRKRLELHKNAVKGEHKGNPPRLPAKKGSGGDKHEKPNTSPLQNEIAEMNKTLGR